MIIVNSRMQKSIAGIVAIAAVGSLAFLLCTVRALMYAARTDANSERVLQLLAGIIVLSLMLVVILGCAQETLKAIKADARRQLFAGANGHKT